jgi:hypothetical protein
MNLSITRKVLTTMNSLEKEDLISIDYFINSFSPESAKLLLEDMLKGKPGEDYLTKMKAFPDGKNYLTIQPVNVIRFELLNRRVNGISVSLKSDIEKLKRSILDKKTEGFLYLPDHVKELIHLHGGGPKVKAEQGAFFVWTDDRKFLFPFIMTNSEQKILDNELALLGNHFIEKLNLSGLSITYMNPIGSQNNSYHDHCWIAFSPKEGMKNSIHLGVRVYADHFRTGLHIGVNLQGIMKENRIKFPYELFDGGSFELYTEDNLESAVNRLIGLKEKWIELNNLFNSKAYEEISNLKLSTNDLGYKEHIFIQNLTTDSSRLQNNGSPRTITWGPQSIESKYLYLLKVEGLRYEAREGFLYKIGVTSNPDERCSNIASGTGIRSLIKIKQLFCLENSGLHEKTIKEFLVANSEIYYDGEFFISTMSSEEVKAYVLSIINGLKHLKF